MNGHVVYAWLSFPTNDWSPFSRHQCSELQTWTNCVNSISFSNGNRAIISTEYNSNQETSGKLLGRHIFQGPMQCLTHELLYQLLSTATHKFWTRVVPEWSNHQDNAKEPQHLNYVLSTNKISLQNCQKYPDLSVNRTAESNLILLFPNHF